MNLSLHKKSPVSYLLGPLADSFGLLAGTGFKLSEVGRGEVPLELAGEPKIDAAGASWVFRDADGLEVAIKARRDEDVCVLRSKVTNRGAVPRFFNRMQVRLDFAASHRRWHLTSSGGGFPGCCYPTSAYETREHFMPYDGLIELSSAPGGRSSDKDLPIAIAHLGSGEDAVGFWSGLEWSGEWYINLNTEGDKGVYLDAGVPISRLCLEPGEELEFPAFHCGVFRGDAVVGTNSLRRYIYQKLQPDYLGERPYPRVSYDHWFGLADDVNEEILKQQVDRAAQIGVEFWTLDATWFGDFDRAIGNWNVADPRKFPQGLEGLADYVRSKGMKMGLWFDCERAFSNSWAAREHRELFFEPLSEGGALHLNLGRRDAQDWLIELISGWISKLGLKWSRFDYNIDPAPYWKAADPTGKIQFAYIQGLYRVLDELRARHPDWMLENCASGGRRTDLGTLARSHTHWFSDYVDDANVVRWMQLRSQRFMPGNCSNSSMNVRRGAGDPASIDHEILAHATNKLGFDGDIACLSEAAAERCRFWVEKYKAFRHLLVQDFYQLTPAPRTPDDWDVVLWSAYDNSEGLVAAYRYEGDESWRGGWRLDESQTDYQVVNLGSGETTTVSGAELIERGVEFTLPTNGEALLHWRRL
ncbi:MAG TPA: glycoside hydrolase family 36 protein [Abditibacterium sp.]|jgi:alpha-galactosidase